MKTTDAESRLSYLLAIEQVEIDADLARYRGRVAELIEDIRSLLHRPREQRTTAIEAKVDHLRLIQAHEFCEDETLPPEVRTFYVALGAESIAQDARIAALGKGTLAHLSRQMEEIRRKEGLADDQYWTADEGPQEYRQLAHQKEELVEKIEQTVVEFFLRRYRLTEHAELYETDRVTFEVQREVGRILMMEGGSRPTESDLLGGYVGKRYGRDAVQRVLSRLEAIRGAV